MISIGSCKLGKIPCVVAIIDRPFKKAVIQKCVSAGVDILEIRVDCFKGSFEAAAEYIHKVKLWTKCPLIGTIRENKKNKSQRLAQFKKIVPLVDCLDIEIDTPIRDAVIALARKKCTIMISEHDFKTTPDLKRLNQIAAQAKKAKAQIVKIAAMAKGADDVTRLLEFSKQCSTPVVAISMGDYGKISRLLAPLFGSLFTYGYISKSVAPGQISVFQLVDDIQRYYPEFKNKRV
jgi:3-dehydroquinate dehydratase-1